MQVGDAVLCCVINISGDFKTKKISVESNKIQKQQFKSVIFVLKDIIKLFSILMPQKAIDGKYSLQNEDRASKVGGAKLLK